MKFKVKDLMIVVLVILKLYWQDHVDINNTIIII